MLRIRLVIWYSTLVLLTVVASGGALYLLLYNSLTAELDATLTSDARTSLRLISSRTSKSVSQSSKKETHSKTIRELIDDALKNAPQNVSGDELTDLVFASITDEILNELSEDKTNAEQVGALLQRTLASSHNYYTEVYTIAKKDQRQVFTSLFRTDNLGQDTLRTIFGIDSVMRSDSVHSVDEQNIGDEVFRGAIAANDHYVIIIAYPETDIKLTIGRLLSMYLYIIPITLLIATIGGIILARKALKPIEDIADTAREISVRNLSRRIEQPSRSDRELTHLVQTLNSMITRLHVSYDQVAQFSSDASHELKTPLAIMKGEIEQAQRHSESGASKELLTSMMEEVERMQRIVEGLLLIAKAEDNRLPLEKEKISLYSFLDSIAEDAEILAADRGLTFTTEFAASLKDQMVEIDTTKFYQVLMNLVDNALKYTPRGGEVTMFLTKAENGIEFGVADTGPGIAPEDLPKVFQRFFRSEEARAHSGSEFAARSLGLGLAISKSIVEAHGGTIRVESKLGKGTRFIVFLTI